MHWLSSRRLTIDNANAIHLDDGELLKLDGASEDSSIDPRTVQACFGLNLLFGFGLDERLIKLVL